MTKIPALLMPPCDETEALLQSLIAECRAIIREVVLPLAKAADEDNARRRYLNSAVDLVKTGAMVGDTIGRLRGGAGPELRQRITVERVQGLSLKRGEGV